MEYGKTIFKCRVGSHLYGLNTPQSDEDFLSVFIPNEEHILGLKKVEEVDNSTKKSNIDSRNTSEDVDDKSYALPKFLHLLLENNPNIIEVLFATPNNILILEPEFKELIDNYRKIVSTKVLHTFTGYAFSQKKKLMVKKERYTSLKEGLDFIEEKIFKFIDSKKNPDAFYQEILDGKFCYNISEEEASDLNRNLKYYKGEKQNCESFHKGMDLGMIYRHIKQEFDNYGWRVKTSSFNKVGYDCKFAYHLIRLLDEGKQLLSTGKVVFPISGKAREDILKIRNELLPYEDLMKMYEEYEKEMTSIVSTVQHKPDWNWADQYLIRTLKNHILRGTI
jgi:predicted nucleotidyltransferase